MFREPFRREARYFLERTGFLKQMSGVPWEIRARKFDRQQPAGSRSRRITASILFINRRILTLIERHEKNQNLLKRLNAKSIFDIFTSCRTLA